MAYGSEADALADAMRLAEGMSLKCAAVDLPAGGAKSVILDGPDVGAHTYRAMGEAVEQMGGRYVCGPDVGTSDADLDQVRAVTKHVNPAGNDAGHSTALGVLAGLRATLRVTKGDASFEGHAFVVQGLGAVGFAVAKELLAGGAQVAGTDLSPDAVARAKEEGVRILPMNKALTEVCDVFVPCALGGVLTPRNAGKLGAAAVCGSANNQLETAETAQALVEAGVLYAPDFMVNAGAVIEGFFTIRDGATAAVRKAAHAHIATIEEHLVPVLESGDPVTEALRVARARLGQEVAEPPQV